MSKLQRYDWSCGAAAVVNALRIFGTRIDEGTVRTAADSCPPSKCKHCVALWAAESALACGRCKWCEECAELKRLTRRTRKDCKAGTDELGLIKALRALSDERTTISPFETDNRDDAWTWLHGSLSRGRPVILCLDEWNHWVTATGRCGDYITIFDPGLSQRNRAESGHHVLDKSRLMKRWVYTKKRTAKDGKRLYAISICRT